MSNDQKHILNVVLIALMLLGIIFVPDYFRKTYHLYIKNRTNNNISIILNPNTRERGMERREYDLKPNRECFLADKGKGILIFEYNGDQYKVIFENQKPLMKYDYDEGLVIFENNIEIENGHLKWLIYKNGKLIKD